MRAALFVRVSTDEQTVVNQERELQEIATRRGWKVVEVYREEGVSGGKSREKRPQLDAMLNAAARRRFDVVLCVALDRLGRSLVDLLNTIQALERSSVDLYIASMSLKGGEPRVVDTTDPRDKLLFQVTAAFSEFERSLINQRIRSGIDRVKAKLAKDGKFETRGGKVRTRLGRPSMDQDAVEAAKRQLKAGASIRQVAKATKLSVGGVHKIATEMRASA
jgi:DNA invertase Pin-like site-specific DNA recombinase